MEQKKTSAISLFLLLFSVFFALSFTIATQDFAPAPHVCKKEPCHREIDHPINQCEQCHPISSEDRVDFTSDHDPGLYRIKNNTVNNGIGACYGCHTPQDLGVSHPVGMLPSKKISIPNTLPTTETGQMLCTTCHYAHKKTYDDLCRLPGSSVLCIVCHADHY